eukprot:3572657-Rhodomonas_salina.3
MTTFSSPCSPETGPSINTRASDTSTPIDVRNACACCRINLLRGNDLLPFAGFAKRPGVRNAGRFLCAATLPRLGAKAEPNAPGMCAISKSKLRKGGSCREESRALMVALRPLTLKTAQRDHGRASRIEAFRRPRGRSPTQFAYFRSEPAYCRSRIVYEFAVCGYNPAEAELTRQTGPQFENSGPARSPGNIVKLKPSAILAISTNSRSSTLSLPFLNGRDYQSAGYTTGVPKQVFRLQYKRHRGPHSYKHLSTRVILI